MLVSPIVHQEPTASQIDANRIHTCLEILSGYWYGLSVRQISPFQQTEWLGLLRFDPFTGEITGSGVDYYENEVFSSHMKGAFSYNMLQSGLIKTFSGVNRNIQYNLRVEADKPRMIGNYCNGTVSFIKLSEEEFQQKVRQKQQQQHHQKPVQPQLEEEKEDVPHPYQEIQQSIINVIYTPQLQQEQLQQQEVKMIEITTKEEKLQQFLSGCFSVEELKKYLIVFLNQEIDTEALTMMTDDDFKLIGIPLGPRLKLRALLSKLQ